MTPRETLVSLRRIQANHKNDFVGTGELRISDMAEDAANAIESLLVFFDSIREYPNCHSCGKAKNCSYAPTLGKMIRYNCPLCSVEG